MKLRDRLDQAVLYRRGVWFSEDEAKELLHLLDALGVWIGTVRETQTASVGEVNDHVRHDL